MIDNTTALSVINNMGTCHSPIWEFCKLHNVTWLTAAHIHAPGSSNVKAHRESRQFHSENTEWMIDLKVLNKALDALNFKPKIDLFASRLNKQFSTYWSDKQFCFQPISCVLRVLQKIIQDKVTGVVVVPMWLAQSWYPILTSLLTLPPSKNLPAFPGGKSPIAQKNDSPYLSTIRKQLKDLGFTPRSTDVIVASW